MTFNLRLMAKTVSLIIALEGLAMVPSIICAAVFGETRVLITFAVVSVFNGDSCGGCFNTIPPQRLIDIASNKKMIICEYCGRILVNPDFD